MATNYRHVSRPSFIREHIEIVRTIGGGEIRCDTCFLSPLTKKEFADIVGCNVSTLSKWLRREPIRQDIADRIRKAVKAVHE